MINRPSLDCPPFCLSQINFTTPTSLTLKLTNITVASTSSVPEPASCAGLAGVFARGVGAMKRRRRQRGN